MGSEWPCLSTGSGPAREILIEGALFNAGPLQDKQIQMFFENPVAQGERIPGLPPLQRLSVLELDRDLRARHSEVGLEALDLVVDVGVRGEEVLPAVVVEIEEAVGPAAARGLPRGSGARRH